MGENRAKLPQDQRPPPRVAGATVITYEYPLSERIRTLLRLEDLFERAGHFFSKEDSLAHHAALLTLFEILEVAGRADLKSDLMQELERQKQVLLSLRNNPQIAENVLKQVISDIERASAGRFAPLLPIRDASSIVLKLLREGGRPVKHVARQGAFSQMLGGKTSQMVRIRLPLDSQFLPEISANRYALNVRFSTFGAEPRPRISEADVEFELTFCTL